MLAPLFGGMLTGQLASFGGKAAAAGLLRVVEFLPGGGFALSHCAVKLRLLRTVVNANGWWRNDWLFPGSVAVIVRLISAAGL
jgi:hypothetical protein